MIIGLVGFIGSGKNSVARYLVEQYGYEQVSFAGLVKDAVSVIFGFDREMLEGTTPETRKQREENDAYWSSKLGLGYDLSPRLALQRMGTEAGRNVFGENLWVNALFRKLKPDGKYVISDVRFPNEIIAIKNSGGKILRCKRGLEPIWYSAAERMNIICNHNNPPAWQILAEYPDVHYSEWAWVGKQFDATIDNGRSIKDLSDEIKRVLVSLGLLVPLINRE